MLAVTEHSACHDMVTCPTFMLVRYAYMRERERETNPSCDIHHSIKRGISFRKENTTVNTFHCLHDYIYILKFISAGQNLRRTKELILHFEGSFLFISIACKFKITLQAWLDMCMVAVTRVKNRNFLLMRFVAACSF